MNDVSSLHDEQIVEIVRSKNKEYYAEIIRRYQNKLMRYAMTIIGDENRANDAVQEGFIKAYINLNGFDIKKKFSSWIYRIVHNESVNLLSKQQKLVPITDDMKLDSGIDLEENVIKNELVSHAHDCLNRMPMLYKEPLSLYYLEEQTYEEISDILRIPINTVGVRINRAKGMMKKLCQKHHV